LFVGNDAEEAVTLAVRAAVENMGKLESADGIDAGQTMATAVLTVPNPRRRDATDRGCYRRRETN
jgi:hypothetical protein